MGENIVLKAVADLVAGDILRKDIGTYKDLKDGTVLDRERIDLLQSLGVRQVPVLDVPDGGKARHLKTDALGREISERIEDIFKRPKGEMKKADDRDDELTGDDDRDTILRHIRKSEEDILVIEGGEKVSLKTINASMDKHIRDLEIVLKRVLVHKQIDLKELEDIVNELILLTGPKRDGSLLLLGIIRKGSNIIVKHAVNTCLLSLAIAVEMTKVMNQQLQKPEVMGDFKKLRICNMKIFNREELVKLGVAAFLHDIGLIDVFPGINEETRIGDKEIARLHLHPSRAFSFLTNLNLDFDIRKAILQHHERADGTGYPDAIEKRLFSKYSLVLSFANYYDLKTSKNPFENKLHPQKALMDIIQRERKAFDDDVIFAFCKAASLYPIGSWVTLSDDTIGLVIKSNHHDLRKPILKVIYSPDLKELAASRVVDLTRSDLAIKDIVDVESIEIFDPRYDRFIFDERAFERTDVMLPTDIAVIESNVKVNGLAENISASGLQFRSALNISRGQHVRLDFEFNRKALKAVLGLVVWKKERSSDSTFAYGVRFTQLDQETHRFILDTVHALIHAGD
jgi:HD-GYP domain-containing protein (c-di-GMP phosphodiesterase class II)